MPILLVGATECGNRKGMGRRRMNTEVEEPHEEVLARFPRNFGRDRDLDHVLRQSLESRRRRTVPEGTPKADKPGQSVQRRGSPEVVPK